MKKHTTEWVAIILAVGLASAVNIMVLAVAWTAITDKSNVLKGLSENATQILIGVFSGIIGILGAYLGLKNKEDKDAEKRD